MNDRIRELAKSVQCEWHWTEEDIEKFAELLIKECASEADNWTEDATEGIYVTDWPSRRILEHFSVKN